jgi:hypothetical protein
MDLIASKNFFSSVPNPPTEFWIELAISNVLIGCPVDSFITERAEKDLKSRNLKILEVKLNSIKNNSS